MPIYRGTAYKDFLIDRCAMGFSTKQICEEFMHEYKLPISEAEIDKILAHSDAEIRKREQELVAELTSKNVINMLSDMKRQLDDAREQVRRDGDFKTYAQLTNSALKSVEILISTTENFKRNLEVKKITNTQNNFFVLQTLEQDGLIKITDIQRLKSLLEINESGDSAVAAEENDHADPASIS